MGCFRGSEQDVLDRFYQAARANQADVIVRITADCPLIDPAVIDKVLLRFERGDCDYVCNVERYTYPDGLDTEVFSFAALERAWREAGKPSEREHVTPYLRTELFRTANVESEIPLSPMRIGGPSIILLTWNSCGRYMRNFHGTVNSDFARYLIY